MTKMRGYWKIVLSVVCGLAAASSARADMLPVSASATQNGMNYTYTYNIKLTTDSKLNSGDYFTIFDFPSPIAGTAKMPANWTLSTAPLGGDPNGTVPGDSPNTPNLTWTYHGPAIVGQTNLGNFSIDTPLGTSAVEPFSFASLTQQAANNANESNITSISVPVGTVTTQGGSSGGTPPGVPEPSTLLLVGIGLPLAGLARRLRSNRLAIA